MKIGNWLGNRAWTDSLEWSGHKAYKKAKTQTLKLAANGTKIGDYKTSSNLTFMRIHAAGYILELPTSERFES